MQRVASNFEITTALKNFSERKEKPPEKKDVPHKNRVVQAIPFIVSGRAPRNLRVDPELGTIVFLLVRRSRERRQQGREKQTTQLESVDIALSRMRT